MLQRMFGAMRLDVRTFEDVEHDSGATLQAALVVIIVAIASGIGGLSGGIGGLIAGIIAGLLQWAIWAFVTYIIGTTLFKTPQTQANWGQLARGTGFAQSPGVFRILGIIPFIGGILVFIVGIWQLIAMVIAVRQALDYESTLRAVGVVVVGFIIVLIVNLILFALLGGLGLRPGGIAF
jgi:hypothetical protein